MSLILQNYIDCENTSESFESLFKRLLLVDADGNLYLRVASCTDAICPAVTEDEEEEPQT